MKLHAYAEDEQLYDSDSDPIALDQRMQREVRKANTWYTEHRMIVNPSKYHAMVLGSTDHQFSFTTKDSLDLLGRMTIDSRLNVDKQVSLICKKSLQSTDCYDQFHKLASRGFSLAWLLAFTKSFASLNVCRVDG